MQVAILILVVVAALAALALWLSRFLRTELGGLREESSAQLAAFKADSSSALAERSAGVDRRLAGIGEAVDRRLAELDKKVDRRLSSAAETTNKIHERLGKANEATAQMLERVKDLSRLEQALRPPKARGGFGELLLENLLRDRLPLGSYTMQHTFRSGERVDAVIDVGGRLVPVDSKFPLDNFERMVEAESDDERQLHEKAFARDVKGHVDAIAGKYVRPDEGTYDFALMYIAAEAIYYELTCGKTGALLKYSHEKSVFPVSPTTFTSQLQVIALGLKGMQIEQHAHEVMEYVADLDRDFGRFREDFDKLGTHLDHASKRFAEAEKRLDRFDGKLQRAVEEQDEEELVLEERPLSALDAA
jgi:DNA recombination protein RmuC